MRSYQCIIEKCELSFTGETYPDEKSVGGKWMHKYRQGSKYMGESVKGFYCLDSFQNKPVPEKYARMIQYADCTIDTLAQIFTGDDSVRSHGSPGPHVEQFLKYVNKETGRPQRMEYDDEKFDEYWGAILTWDSTRFPRIDREIVGQPEFEVICEQVVNEALTTSLSNPEFEEYVERCYSKGAEIKLKRSRKVVGQCNMDNRPCEHAIRIVVLAAETWNWEIFLRAHLHVMNDKVPRVSDGSWAREERRTYIKELEELDVNVPDLFLGITMRIENPSENHYFGNIGCLGRALSDTIYFEEVENTISAMISDDKLDYLNRLLVYYLFHHYNSYLDDEVRKENNANRLSIAHAELGSDLQRAPQ